MKGATVKVKEEFEFLTSDDKVIKWYGATMEDAAQSCAHTLGTTIVAWRYPRCEIVFGVPIIIE